MLDIMDEWTGKFSIINFYLSICARTDIRAYPQEGLKLIDIGKPETLAQADEWLRERGNNDPKWVMTTTLSGS